MGTVRNSQADYRFCFCPLQDVYPTQEFFDTYHPNAPLKFTLWVAGTFFGVIVAFVLYDYMVQFRNRKMIKEAAKARAVLTSLFPTAVRDRILDNTGIDNPRRNLIGNEIHVGSGETVSSDDESSAMAEFFVTSTVLFADIVGFTAWSSYVQ